MAQGIKEGSTSPRSGTRSPKGRHLREEKTQKIAKMPKLIPSDGLAAIQPDSITHEVNSDCQADSYKRSFDNEIEILSSDYNDSLSILDVNLQKKDINLKQSSASSEKTSAGAYEDIEAVLRHGVDSVSWPEGSADGAVKVDADVKVLLSNNNTKNGTQASSGPAKYVLKSNGWNGDTKSHPVTPPSEKTFIKEEALTNDLKGNKENEKPSGPQRKPIQADASKRPVEPRKRSIQEEGIIMVKIARQEFVVDLSLERGQRTRRPPNRYRDHNNKEALACILKNVLPLPLKIEPGSSVQHATLQLMDQVGSNRSGTAGSKQSSKRSRTSRPTHASHVTSRSRKEIKEEEARLLVAIKQSEGEKATIQARQREERAARRSRR